MENLICKFTIPITPRTKKNSQRIVKCGKYHRIIPSKAYMEYEKKCMPYIPALMIDKAINLKAVYYMPTRHKVDLCNLHEALCDVLVKYNCVTDDNSKIISTLDGSCVRYDKDNPRTEVFISRL